MRRDVIILFFSFSSLFNARGPGAHMLSTEILGAYVSFLFCGGRGLGGKWGEDSRIYFASGSKTRRPREKNRSGFWFAALFLGGQPARHNARLR